MNRAVNNSNDSVYEEASRHFSNEPSYNEPRVDYSQSDDEYYQNYEPKIYPPQEEEKVYQDEPEQVDQIDDSSETVIRRHFDKFKK